MLGMSRQQSELRGVKDKMMIAEGELVPAGILCGLPGHAVRAVLPHGQPAGCHSRAGPTGLAATQRGGPEHAGRWVSSSGDPVHVPAAGRSPPASQVRIPHGTLTVQLRSTLKDRYSW